MTKRAPIDLTAAAKRLNGGASMLGVAREAGLTRNALMVALLRAGAKVQLNSGPLAPRERFVVRTIGNNRDGVQTITRVPNCVIMYALGRRARLDDRWEFVATPKERAVVMRLVEEGPARANEKERSER